MIELIVVLAIITVLIGLLLPAVQRVRDAAQRLSCANNVRQLALAVHQHHNTMGRLPVGMRYKDGTDPYLCMSWLTQILPYVEQDNLWLATVEAYRKASSPFPNNNPPHVGLDTVIKTFVCPADPRAGTVHLSTIEHIPVALTSYLGVEGKDVYQRNGVLFGDSNITMASIVDGTAYTLLVGERPPSGDYQFEWWYAGAGQDFTGSGDMVLGVEELNILPYSMSPCFSGPYRFGPGKIDGACDMFHFWSLHGGGGANFAMCDGSVRYITYAAAPLLPSLASRAGGEPMDDL